MQQYKRWLSLLIFWLVVHPVGAASPVKQSSFRLSNGMRVTCIEVHQNPVISSTVVVRVGLGHETPDINGVSHLLEHLTFNGTETRTQEQFYRDLDRFGCYCNASTGDDYTAYYLLAPTEQFSQGLVLQADMLLRASIPADKIEKEKQIVLEEIRRDRGRRGYDAESAARSFLFRGTPYAMRVIGSEESVQQISRDAIVSFYRKWYRPENMEMLIVGDITAQQLRPLVTRLFGEIPKSGKEVRTGSVGVHTGSGIQVLNGGNLAVPELRMVFDVDQLRDRHDELAIFIELLDRDLKKHFSETDPRIGCNLSVTAGSALVNLTVHLDRRATREAAESIRDRLLRALQMVKVSPTDVAALVRKREVDELYGLERPHFYGMLAAPEIATGTFRGVSSRPVFTRTLVGLGETIASQPRADLLLLPGGEK